MLSLLGILVILCGFAAPYLIGYPPPGSIFFFWTGFLLLFWPTNPLFKTSNWLKWGRIGLMVNVLVTISFFVLIYLENYELFFRFFYIPNPIGTILGILFPEKIPLGIIGRTIIAFFNVLLCIGLATIIGNLIVRKRQQKKLKIST